MIKNLTTLSSKELKSLDNNGYVLLKRNNMFWKNHSIDLKKIKDKCEELINIEGKSVLINVKTQQENKFSIY